jgi:hypothetical protein
MEENVTIHPHLPRLGEPAPSFEAETTRELVAAGLLEPTGENFGTTDKGDKALEGSIKV